MIAGQAVRWLRDRASVVAEDQPWFTAVDFVNPHDIMSFDCGGRAQVELPFGLAHAVVAEAAADIPVYRKRWDFDLPASLHDDLSGAAPAVAEYARMLDTVFGPVADEAHWYDGLNFYLNALRDVDRGVELVLDAREASGQADRTVVVFTTDHRDSALIGKTPPRSGTAPVGCAGGRGVPLRRLRSAGRARGRGGRRAGGGPAGRGGGRPV